MPKLKIGDRVDTLGGHYGKGTVLSFIDGYVGVRLDDKTGYHDLRGLCEDRHGIYLLEEAFTLIDEKETITGDPRVEGEL